MPILSRAFRRVLPLALVVTIPLAAAAPTQGTPGRLRVCLVSGANDSAPYSTDRPTLRT